MANKKGHRRFGNIRALPSGRIDVAGLDEGGQVGSADPYVPADTAETDATLGDQPSHEPDGRRKVSSDLLNGHQRR